MSIGRRVKRVLPRQVKTGWWRLLQAPGAVAILQELHMSRKIGPGPTNLHPEKVIVHFWTVAPKLGAVASQGAVNTSWEK